MPTPIPILGNDSFSKNRKTAFSASDIVSSQRTSGQAYLYEVEGNFTPTTTDSGSVGGVLYNVLDKNNVQVQVPPNAILNYVVAHSDVALTTAAQAGDGGMGFYLALTTANGGGTRAIIGATGWTQTQGVRDYVTQNFISLTGANVGYGFAVTGWTGSTNTYLTAMAVSTGSRAFTAGTVTARVIYSQYV
jgi:hypothetical protein